jgi:hypothetical protein
MPGSGSAATHLEGEAADPFCDAYPPNFLELRKAEVRRSLLRGWMKKGYKRRPGRWSRPFFPMLVWLLSGRPYLAIQLLEERLSLLVELLVIANQLQLLHGKIVEAS